MKIHVRKNIIGLDSPDPRDDHHDPLFGADPTVHAHRTVMLEYRVHTIAEGTHTTEIVYVTHTNKTQTLHYYQVL